MKGRIWLLLLAAVGLAALATRQRVLVVFALILGLATLVSELWTRFCLNSLTYKREISADAVPFGEKATLTLEVVNAKPMPLAWLLIRDRFPAKLQLETGTVRQGSVSQTAWLDTLLSVGWYERVVRTHEVTGTARGEHVFGPELLSSGDILSFRRREATGKESAKLLVYPRVVPLDALELVAGRPHGELNALRRLSPDMTRFSHVRAYAPGDSPRHIHWKATARTQQLQTKVFEPGAASVWVVALDVQTLPRSYESIPELLEYCIVVAASLAQAGLDDRRQVGLAVNGPGGSAEAWQYLAPARGMDQHLAMLAMLAKLGTYRGLSFSEMLRTMMPGIPAGAAVIAISPHQDTASEESLHALEQAGHPVRLFTAGELEPDVSALLNRTHLGGRHAWTTLQTLDLG